MSDTTETTRKESVGDTGLLLSVAASAAGRNVNAALESVALRVRTFSILELAACSDGINQRRLADALLLNPSQVVALVDDLVGDGLVERRPDPTDRRNRLVWATEKGRLRYAEARALADQAVDRTLRVLQADERATLHRLLQRILGSVST
jgi:DNA-binding MarR family transcriptional regulator